jgi:universal stress protein A
MIGDGPIVCGVDFSEPSRRALRYAHALAGRLGQPLIVVGAIDPLIAEAAARTGPGPFLDRARRDLEELVRTTFGAVDASFLVPVGPPDRELLAAARTARASAIVVGTEGLGRAHRLVFGSTTRRVMRQTDRPVLAVPPEKEGGAEAGVPARILCGVDFSEASRSAARAAVALGQRLGVPVTLVHAVGRFTLPSIWETMMAPTDEEREAQARDNLDALAAAVGSPRPATLAAAGEAHEIFARESTGETLIVLGLGDLSGHRPGATALRIMAETHTPVLAVPRTT